MSKPPIEVVGLKEFTRELRRAGKEFPKELAKAHQEVAGFVVERVRPVNRQQRKALPGIKAARQQRGAVVVAANTRRNPFTIGSFFGAREFPQFPPWIGNQWDPGDSVDGRYGIPFAIHRDIDRIADIYGERIADIARRAFPHKGAA